MFERGEGSVANRAQRAAWIWRELPVPVVAAVHGHAFGGGLQIALCADIRIVAPDAQLSVMEVEWGLVPDMTGSQTLRSLVRLDVALELAFTGRRVSGREAVALGLATRLSDDPLDEARALARQIAQKSPDAVRAAKRLLCAAWTSNVAQGLELEEREQRALIGTTNQLEAVQARIGKRAPAFEDPK
jgi:enoyl-CoA hydratase/carnithine racemase